MAAYETSAELTDEQIRQENGFLKGLPRLNIGALMLPPIWGAANGIWVTVLFYPVWLFADNCFYQAFTEPTTLAVVLAVIVFVTLLAITVIFAIVSQPFAAHRAESMGVSREKYLARQRKWAIGCTIGGIVLLALATFYNLVIRPTVGA